MAKPPQDQDIHKIVDVFNKQLEVPKFSRMVPSMKLPMLKRLQPQHTKIY
jgi:hypothetical protein